MNQPDVNARASLSRVTRGLFRDPWAAAFVVICTVTAFLLGAFHLGVPSIWGDEGASISIASQNGTALFRAVAHDGGNLALFYLILHVIISLFGTGTDTLRMFSVLCATALTPMSYLLARALFSRRAGLFSAALCTMSLPIINWAQQVRGYTLVTLLLVSSSLALAVALRDGRKRLLIVYGVLAVASCYTELLAAIVVTVQVLTVIIHPRSREMMRSIVVTAGVMVVGLIPLGLIAEGRGSNQLFWLGRPNAFSVREDTAFLSSARPNTLTTYTSHMLTELTVILVCAGVVLGIAHAIIRRRAPFAYAVVLAALWLVAPPVISYCISMIYHPVFLDRYFVMCIPGMTLLISYVLSLISPMPLAWVCCAVVIGLRAQQLPNTYNISIDEWRLATTTVVNESRPGDCVAFYFNDGFTDFAYYLEHPPTGMNKQAAIPRSVLPAVSFGSDPGQRSLADYPAIVESYKVLDAAQVAAVEKSCPVLFMVVNHDGQSSDSAGAEAVSNNFVTMRNRLQVAYGTVTSERLRSITIYRYFHEHLLSSTSDSLRSGT